MVLPLVIGGAMLGGYLVSTGAKLYSQWNQRKVYRNEEKANRAMENGYNDYLQRQGLSANPNRSWNSYHGAADRAKVNLGNSYADSVGTLAGGIGKSASLYDSAGLERIYNRL